MFNKDYLCKKINYFLEDNNKSDNCYTVVRSIVTHGNNVIITITSIKQFDNYVNNSNFNWNSKKYEIKKILTFKIDFNIKDNQIIFDLWLKQFRSIV